MGAAVGAGEANGLFASVDCGWAGPPNGLLWSLAVLGADATSPYEGKTGGAGLPPTDPHTLPPIAEKGSGVATGAGAS